MLVPDEDLPDWLEKRPLFHSPFALITRRDHPAMAASGVAPGDVMPLDLFCALPHVLYSPQGRMTAMTDSALDRIGRKRRVIMTLPTFAGVCRTVSRSDAVSMVPLKFARSVSSYLASISSRHRCQCPNP